MGRPILRWADSIQHDFKVAKLTSKNWIKKAENREDWKNFTKYLGEPAQMKKREKKKKETQRELKKRGNSQGQL